MSKPTSPIPSEFHGQLLPGLPAARIYEAYIAAPGDEIASGKFASPESSAALAANAFGWFLDRPSDMPALPGCEDLGWPALSLHLEAIVRFPWSGGHHPCLDALVRTSSTLIGVESKRYEPFRSKEAKPFSDAYWRPVWGSEMAGYESVRDALTDGSLAFSRLDAGQLVRHAFGLRTMAARPSASAKVRPVLVYLYAEPPAWPDEPRRTISEADREQHRQEITKFAAIVANSEVIFRSCSYRALLDTWLNSPTGDVAVHARAVEQRFAICETSCRD